MAQLDTLNKYSVTNADYAVYHKSERSISFGSRHLSVGVGGEPMNSINASQCRV